MKIKEDVGQYETVYTVTVEHEYSDEIRTVLYDTLRNINEEKQFIKAIDKLLEMGWVDDVELWVEQMECYGSYNTVMNRCDECPLENFCRRLY